MGDPEALYLLLHIQAIRVPLFQMINTSLVQESVSLTAPNIQFDILFRIHLNLTALSFKWNK